MARSDERSTDARVDELVRNALEPGASAARRIVLNALAEGSRTVARQPRRHSRWLVRAVPAAVVIAIGIAIGFSISRPGPAPDRAPRGVISNEGDIIVLTAPDRSITLIGTTSPAPPAPRGTATIVLLGEPQ